MIGQGQISWLWQSESLLGHYVVEVLARDFLVVGASPFKHLDELLLVHGLAELLSNSLDVVNVDESASIVVEQIEDLVDAGLNQIAKYLCLLVAKL